ncbi:MAG: hypothetical protein IT175_03125 [Acidobacteria bacterium]|nr:hypothetical protein [Acidobacteriota bacterium]
MSDRLTQIAAVVAMLRNGQIASYEATGQVLEIMVLSRDICDPIPKFSPEEREEIICSSFCPLFIAGLKEVLPDHLPEAEVKLMLATPGYGFGFDYDQVYEGVWEKVATT